MTDYDDLLKSFLGSSKSDYESFLDSSKSAYDDLLKGFLDSSKSTSADELKEALKHSTELKADPEKESALALIAARLGPGVTKAEALAHAIGFYKTLCNHLYEGGEVEFIKSDGSKQKLKLKVH